MYITVEKVIPKKGATLKSIYQSITKNFGSSHFSPNLEITETIERIPKSQMLWNTVNPIGKDDKSVTIFNKKIQKQRNFQVAHIIKHSKDCEMLVTLFQMLDSKRYNIPSSQIANAYQTSQKNFKQTDIRNMFCKSSNSVVNTLEIQGQVLLRQLPEDKSCLGTKQLFDEISDYLSIKMSGKVKKCRHCPELINCEAFKNPKQTTSINWTEIDAIVYKSVTLQDIQFFKITDKNEKTPQGEDFDNSIHLENINFASQLFQTQNIVELDDFIDKSILTNFFNESVRFQAPNSFNRLLNKTENSNQSDSNKNFHEEIYEDSLKTKINEVALNNMLDFFKLESVLDIYIPVNELTNSQATVLYSPDMFDVSPPNIEKCDNEINKSDGSPVLCSNRKKLQLEKLKLQSVSENIDSPSKFSMNVTKISSTPHIISQKESISKRLFESLPLEQNPLNLNDLCDMSIFGLSGKKDEFILKKIDNNSSSSISKTALLSDSFGLEDFCVPVGSTNLCQIQQTPVCNFLNDSLNIKMNNIKDAHHYSKEDMTISDSMFNDQSYNNIKKADFKNNTNNTLQKDEFISHCNSPLLEMKKCSSKYKINSNNESQTKLNNAVDTHSLCKEPQVYSVDLTSLPETGITQIISLINKPSNNQLPKEERSESELFNFSFNCKKTPTKREKTSHSNNISDIVVIKSPIFRQLDSPSTTTKDNSKFERRSSSDDDFEPKQKNDSFIINQKQDFPKIKSRREIRKEIIKDFIDHEAELSLCQSITVSDDEVEENEQSYDRSFIEDETQNINTQMHLKYIQSVRSPVINNGGFKIPKRSINQINVYSQEVDNRDNTYLEDSFVVQEEESIVFDKEYSQLELLEMKIKEKKQKYKRINGKPLKRKRIIVCSDDSQ